LNLEVFSSDDSFIQLFGIVQLTRLSTVIFCVRSHTAVLLLLLFAVVLLDGVCSGVYHWHYGRAHTSRADRWKVKTNLSSALSVIVIFLFIKLID
jgi:nicotinamide riboside transporter PnuC